MRVLIFDNTLSGHHLEYLNLIYKGILGDKSNEYIFAVPGNEWGKKKNLCLWPNVENVEWLMVDDEICENVKKGSLLISCYKQSKLVRDIVLRHKIDLVFMISLTGVIPILPLILSSKVKLSGIIYKIFLHRKISKFRLVIEKLRYRLMANSTIINKVFILNDPKSVMYLNKKYNSTKFISLPDPVPQKPVDLVSLRNKYGINSEDVIFLHFGSMDRRKGTIEILKSVNNFSHEELENKVFIFSGKISPIISKEFYFLVENCKNRGARIIVENEFCEYSHLNNLCYTCDCLLIPYLLTDLSSGALGYASIYNKPVIGPSSGLIGELIRENNLGICLDEISPLNIAKAISQFNKYYINSDYAEKNSPESFIKVILNLK